MMCDTNWCTFCDNAISPYSDSLYCSEECLRQDALRHHPMLGYDYAELNGFPHINNSTSKSNNRCISTTTTTTTTTTAPSPSNASNYFSQLHKLPSLSPSLSSSPSSIYSPQEDNHDITTYLYYQPKPRRTSVPLMEHQQALHL